MSKIMLLSLALSCATPQVSFADAEKTVELARTIEKARPKGGKAAVLAALPQELKENFVLVKKSRSRQRGTPALPRVLHFTKTADLVVSSSGHDATADRAANDLEVMEFDEPTGRWVFSTITFDETGVTGVHKNVPMCMHCHGHEARPIWGDYPKWPTAYGGSLTEPEKMEGQELADFVAFNATAPLHEGYRHLVFDFSKDRYSLTNSTYGLPNSVFTARLGNLTAKAISIRAKTGAAKDRAAFAAAALSCALPGSVEKRVASDYTTRVDTDQDFSDRWSGSEPPKDTLSLATRLLDVDPTVDFELAKFPAQSAKTVSMDLQAPWNSGSDYIHVLVAFRFFHEFWSGDPGLQETLAGEKAEIEAIARDTFGASNSDLSGLDSQSTSKAYLSSLYPYLHSRVWKDAKSKKVVCEALVARAL